MNEGGLYMYTSYMKNVPRRRGEAPVARHTLFLAP